MLLGDAVGFHQSRAADLPGAGGLADTVRAIIARLERLRAAATPEVYQGPVLFEGEAAAELFAGVFAPVLAARRTAISDNPMLEQFAARRGGSFLDRIGTRVLPRFLSVVDNPALESFDGRLLSGYKVDDDGVPARETLLIERGILRTLVTSRVPVKDLRRSTGNRWGYGVSLTNVVVSADSALNAAALRRRALDLAAANGNTYVIVVRRIARLAAASPELHDDG
jgi:predicted Zn-dependent protease